MGKRIIIIFSLVLSSFSLFSCATNEEQTTKPVANQEQNIDNNENKLSEDAIRELTKTTDKRKYDILDVKNLDSNYVIIDGLSYSTSTEYKNKEDIKKYLNGYLTEDAINRLIESHTLEKNNKFYIAYGQRGSSTSIEKDKLSYKQNGDTLIATFYKIIDADLFKGYKYEFKLVDNEWLLNSINDN